MASCISKGLISKESIVEEALREIEEIDLKIKEVEVLKITRSKLLDVVNIVSEPKKEVAPQKKILCFLNIHNPKVCKLICDILSGSSILISELKTMPNYNDEFMLCIKQLQENRIISRIGNSLVRGEMFIEYYNYLSYNG
jgi:hypothetical protein